MESFVVKVCMLVGPYLGSINLQILKLRLKTYQFLKEIEVFYTVYKDYEQMSVLERTFSQTST